ncbi:MAG: PIN domain-containing protein [Wenzhouxiangella sp.]
MILIDTNVLSETLKPKPDDQVIRWLSSNDEDIWLPVIVIAEIAYGIERIRPDQRAGRLAQGLDAWRGRFHDRICMFSESDALVYGRIMGQASQSGRPMAIPDGMIAAMAIARGGSLATRNIRDFSDCGVKLVNPWELRPV